jgi:hypothetical protein
MRPSSSAIDPEEAHQADREARAGRTVCSRRDFGRSMLGLFAAAATGCRRSRLVPVLSAEDEAFLKTQARRIVDAARLAAGGAAGDHHNTTPYDLRVPGGNMGYPAYWVRDSVMMLGGDLISAAEVEGWIRLIVSTLRGPSDWEVRPGVVIPAYAVPDHVNFDGRPTFYPGNYETGDRQGGPPWGKYPPLDDGFYFLAAVHEHWRLTKDLRLFGARLKTSFSEEKLTDLCEKVYAVPLSDPKTGLVTAGDIEKENAKDWGFCDGVSKSGKLLFPSILKFRAARRLAELFAASGDAQRAAAYRRDAGRITASLGPTFLRPALGGTEGWLHSATGVGNQPDVWGSAFAVHSGVLDAPTARAVSSALARAFRERTAVQDGLIRHIPTTDRVNQGGWEVSAIDLGTYQNGGYWGTPVGWYISALHGSDPAAASDLAGEYVRSLRRDMRPDGMTQAWEWVNTETAKASNPLYVASVALPYLSLLEAGLLRS